MENKLYEISVYTENQVGLLSAVTNIFTRRSLNIENLMAFPSEVHGIHRIIFYCRTDREEQIIQAVRQIEKKVEVIKAFYYIEEERREREVELVQNWIEKRNNINE